MDSAEKNRPSATDLQRCATERQAGNEQFKMKQYAKAVMHYSRAIEANPHEPAPYCNRAMALMKMERFQEAYGDCCKAIGLQDCYEKAYYRRAVCLIRLNRASEAIEDLQKTLQLDPANEAAKRELQLLTGRPKDPLLVDVVENPSPEQLQKPLRAIAIREVFARPLEEQKQAVHKPLHHMHVKQYPPPDNAIQLLSDWKSQRLDSRILGNYILSIPLDRFAALFAEFISASVLSDGLTALRDVAVDRGQVVAAVRRLRAWTDLKRFGSASMFLSGEDKVHLLALLERADAVDELTDDCRRLRESFRVG